MFKHYRIIIFMLIITSTANSAALTYGLSGGRLGDNLLTYLHAAWLSYKYNIPLVYNPFPYSSELMLADFHSKKLTSDFASNFTLTFNLIHRKNLNNLFNKTNDMLFVCPYFPEIQAELDYRKKHDKKNYFYFPVNWSDKEFRKIATTMIAPKQQLQLVEPPSTTLNIAMHIREGGGYDRVDFTLVDPLKSPPLTFYIESLLHVLEVFDSYSIYCYIFTDAINPEDLSLKIQEKIPATAPIMFDFRKTNNHHNANVLEDFFSLLNFEILIHPASNFSIVPSLIHDYILTCHPKEFSIKNNTVNIDKIDYKINKKLYDFFLSRTNKLLK